MTRGTVSAVSKLFAQPLQLAAVRRVELAVHATTAPHVSSQAVSHYCMLLTLPAL